MASISSNEPGSSKFAGVARNPRSELAFIWQRRRLVCAPVHKGGGIRCGAGFAGYRYSSSFLRSSACLPFTPPAAVRACWQTWVERRP